MPDQLGIFRPVRAIAACTAVFVALSLLATEKMKSKSARTALFYDPVFMEHDTGSGHPESPARITAIMDRLKKDVLYERLLKPPFQPATLAAIRAVHSDAYINVVRESVETGKGTLPTGDTMISPKTWEASLMAAGAGIAACDGAMLGLFQNAFCIIRPPGHHASKSKGMGFCVFNNAAIAARHLQNQHGIKRVLVVDFDVHHGNGTQDIFYEDGTVFYFSIHQDGIYPRTGAVTEKGAGKGAGCIINVPLNSGATDAQALAAIRTQLIPAMETFKPEFILVSAGFDAHQDDPLGGLSYTADGYGSIASELMALAKKHARSRIVFLLEGGYNLNGLSSSIATILNRISQDPH